MRIVGVDIGIKHLGLAEITQRRVGDEILSTICGFHLHDITKYTHERVPRAACTLHHTNELGDRLQHWKQEHGYILDRADHVAIERQPITGLQCIQAFLFSTWREKAFMVHPRTLHKYMGCGILDYDGRKRYMEQNAAATCKALGVDWEKCTARFARRHDVADALAIAMFALSERGGGLGLRKRNPFQAYAHAHPSSVKPRMYSSIDQPIVVSKYFKGPARL